MNSLKKGEGVPLLNFEGGPGVPLLNFRGVSRPTFKLWGGFRVPGSRGPGSRGPGLTFTPCQKVRLQLGDYATLSLKCKISAIWLVETASIFLICLITTVQISMKSETHKKAGRNIQNTWIQTNLTDTYEGIG